MGSECEIKVEPKTIFISYGHDDRGAPLAKKLKESLELAGHTAWLDETEIKAGHDWEIEIEEGIARTHLVIALLTPHAVRRPDGVCLDELSYARFRGKTIIPLMVDECQPPLSIARIQWLDVQDYHQSDARYQQKIELIMDLVEGRRNCFEGTQSDLLNRLAPIDFKADIDKYVRGFSGRQWVFDSIDAWLADENASRVFFLTGDAGVGKSAIAARLCQRHPRVFAFHLCVYGHKTKSDPLRCVQSLAYQLSSMLPDYRDRLANIILADDADAHTAFDELIIQPLHGMGGPGEPILIVIDALDEATRGGHNELAEFLARVFDLTPPWLRLLITSRPEHPVIDSLARHKPRKLDSYKPENLEDIRQFLKRRLPQIAATPVSETTAEAILEKSEGIFLYVVLVLEELRLGRLSLDRPDEFPHGLRAVYKLFFDRYFSHHEEGKRKAKKAYYDQYQRPLLELVAAAQEPLSLELIANVLDWDKTARKRAVDPLGSLFRVTDGCLSPFHRSILDWLTHEDTDLSYFIDPANGHARLADTGWVQFKDNPSTMDAYLGRHLPSHFLITDETKKLMEFLSSIEVFIDYHGDDLYPYLRYWNLMYEREGESHWDLSKCSRILMVSLKKWENSTEGKHRNWQAYWSIGRLFCELHENERAVDMFKKSLSYAPSDGPDKDTIVARLYNEIGEAFFRLNRIADAEPYYQDALDIRQKSQCGPQDLAESTNNCGHAYFHRDKFSEALEFYEQALEIWKKVPGGPHYGVADSLNNMASSLEQLGRLEETKSRYEECSRALDSLDYFNWGVPVCRDNYGNFLVRTGDHAEAERQYILAYDVCMQTYGPGDESTIKCTKAIAMLYFHRGKPEKAIARFRELVEASEARYGRNHPKTIHTFNLLGEMLITENKFSEAKKLFSDIVNRIGASKTCDSETDVQALHHMGVCCFGLGEYEDALSYLIKAFRLREELYPLGHEYILRTFQYLLEAYMRIERLEEAARLASEYHSKHVAGMQKDGNLYFECQALLARKLRICGQWESAEKIYREIVKNGVRMMKAQGEDSGPKDIRIFQLAVAYNEVAFHSLAPQERWAEAREFYQKAIGLMSTQDSEVESANMRLNLFNVMWKSGADLDLSDIEKETLTLEKAGDSRAEKGRKILDSAKG